MAIDYPGVVEAWVNDFSIHGRGKPARFWVGNNDDTGGLFMRAVKTGAERWGEVATQRFTGTDHGSLRLRTVGADDRIEVWNGTRDEATRQLAIGATGPAAAPGIRFGANGDTNLYRSTAGILRTDHKLISDRGLGVGNSAPATTLGNVTRKMEIFDASGASLGYIPVYDTID